MSVLLDVIPVVRKLNAVISKRVIHVSAKKATSIALRTLRLNQEEYAARQVIYQSSSP